MVKTHLSSDRSQAGFTLVELAIVMIIIGLLIGGILKGQELIANAQITATSSQVRAVEAAMTTFRDFYNAVPGDMLNSATRLPNCGAAPCSDPGDGNNRVDENAVGAIQVDDENSRFWTQLATADMIGGVSGTSTTLEWGEQLPAAEVGGGFTVGYAAGTLGLGTVVPGHYLSLQLEPGTAASSSFALSPTQAARIDRKLDDGNAATGGVVGEGGSCDDGAGVYEEATTTIECALYMRIQ